MADTTGLKYLVVSSWKLLASVTSQSSSLLSEDTDMTAFPMFPTTYVFLPERLNISPVRVVVVVFPFVPVIAT